MFICSNVFCQNIDTNQVKAKPQRLPNWTLLVPGGSYFYEKDYLKGSIFSALEISGIYIGLKYNSKLKTNSTSPYYNYPLLLGLQAFNIEKVHNFKNRLECIKYSHPDFKYDDISEIDLYLAPFKTENIFTPITVGCILLAGVFLGIEKMNEKQSWHSVDKMYFIDRYIDKNQGLAIFGATSMATSWSAGVAEEYIFRNFLMSKLDYKYGQQKGLIYSSVLFGSMHFGNLMFSNNPDYKGTLLQVAEASIIGYFLGWDVQNRGYKIGPAVAAHAWYDFTLMLGSFLINPKNNVFGVGMQFKIN